MSLPSNVAVSTGRIRPLDGWRVLFVFSVALAHSGQTWAVPIACCGVVLFFVSSGFLLAMRHGQECMEISVGRYWRCRMLPLALRFYSIHWLVIALLMAMLMAFGANAGQYYWPALPVNALLLQEWIPVERWFYSFYVPSWYLGTLLFCHACFPWLYRWLMRMSLRVLFVGSLVVWSAYAVLLSSLTNPVIVKWIHVLPVARLWEFALGIVVYRCYSGRLRMDWLRAIKTRRWLAALSEWAVLALAAVLVAASIVSDSPFMFKLDDCWLWEPSMACLMLFAALNAGHEGVVGRAVGCRPLLLMAGFMIELYMLQGLAGLCYNHFVAPVFGHFGFVDAYDWYVWAHLPVLAFLAWVLHRWFTQPVARFVSRLSS